MNLATGTRCSFGKASPAGFSPDGTRLLYTTQSASGTTSYLADPITGTSEPFDHPGTIIAWDGGTPRQLPARTQSGRRRGDRTDPTTSGEYPDAQCLLG